MRFLHISDIHIGKSVHDTSMIDDQKYILKQIISIIKEKNVDAAIIAGDVYDKSVPSEEAVSVLSEFLDEINTLGKTVYVIYGNHDSAERINFLKPVLSKQNIHISDRFNGKIEKLTTEDEYGKLNICMLPFFKRSEVRSIYDDDTIETPDDAFKTVLDNSNIDPEERNILISHQFFMSKGVELERGGSESIESIGGTDCISSALLKDFDYVALGHIHKAQQIGRETVRYCGSPLKYSESECLHEKSAVIFDIGKKNDVKLEFVKLEPVRDLRSIKGTVSELIERGKESPDSCNDYVYIELTEDELDAKQKLSRIYKNILFIKMPSYSGSDTDAPSIIEMKNKTPLELFKELFVKVNGKELTSEQEKIFSDVVKKAMEVKE